MPGPCSSPLVTAVSSVHCGHWCGREGSQRAPWLIQGTSALLLVKEKLSHSPSWRDLGTTVLQPVFQTLPEPQVPYSTGPGFGMSSAGTGFPQSVPTGRAFASTFPPPLFPPQTSVAQQQNGKRFVLCPSFLPHSSPRGCVCVCLCVYTEE